MNDNKSHQRLFMSFKGAIEQVYMLPAWISSDIQMFSSIISVSQFD